MHCLEFINATVHAGIGAFLESGCTGTAVQPATGSYMQADKIQRENFHNRAPRRSLPGLRNISFKRLFQEKPHANA